ncbi:hypothetical protein SARC_04363 [Sphaeroforma arctica JP610]|uniref:C2H2-type domain-containing protein n=1 Tax=Sphaeroforma arctica JP610 TaxID=667725 RepID=A0A0L0G2N3_9EUKA|nr:hypothetical protein SARC_04363 [Sphaeroforma arctica JP610]KNC83397.1 hypothetical protein SARC_04363 [Sphaeroforma arctica JP610]|eukprot:XP_014157299.1 hypothetical protein SARC_04363 [Sphaeroforma arctica JP610]
MNKQPTQHLHLRVRRQTAAIVYGNSPGCTQSQVQVVNRVKIAGSPEKPDAGKKRVRKSYAEEERLFKCEYCSRSYAFEHSRNQHVRSKHVKRSSSFGFFSPQAKIRSNEKTQKRHSDGSLNLSAIRRTLGDVFKKGTNPYTRYNEMAVIAIENQLQCSVVAGPAHGSISSSSNKGEWVRATSDVKGSHLATQLAYMNGIASTEQILHLPNTSMTTTLTHPRSDLSKSVPESNVDIQYHASAVQRPSRFPMSWSRPKRSLKAPQRTIDHVRTHSDSRTRASIAGANSGRGSTLTKKTSDGWVHPQHYTEDLTPASNQKSIYGHISMTTSEYGAKDAAGNTKDANPRSQSRGVLSSSLPNGFNIPVKEQELFESMSPERQLQALFSSMGDSFSETRIGSCPLPGIAMTNEEDSQTIDSDTHTRNSRSNTYIGRPTEVIWPYGSESFDAFMHTTSEPYLNHQGCTAVREFAQPMSPQAKDIEGQKPVHLKQTSVLDIDMWTPVIYLLVNEVKARSELTWHSKTNISFQEVAQQLTITIDHYLITAR